MPTDYPADVIDDIITQLEELPPDSHIHAYRNIQNGSRLVKSSSSNSVKYLAIEQAEQITALLPDKVSGSRIHTLFPKRTGETPYSTGNDFYDVHGTLRDGRHSTTLQQLLAAGVGDCLEMAAVVQLAAQQRGINSTLINGTCLPEDDFMQHHAYNIFQTPTGIYLIDAANIQRARIEGIRQHQDGSLEVLTTSQQGLRHYLN